MHSWNDATTRPARLRVVNNSEHDVHVLWVTEAGKEVPYSSLAACNVHMQSAVACCLYCPALHAAVITSLFLRCP